MEIDNIIDKYIIDQVEIQKNPMKKKIKQAGAGYAKNVDVKKHTLDTYHKQIDQLQRSKETTDDPVRTANIDKQIAQLKLKVATTQKQLKTKRDTD